MEKVIFLDKFMQFPKNFSKIASFLTNRSTKDCVRFYYDSKAGKNMVTLGLFYFKLLLSSLFIVSFQIHSLYFKLNQQPICFSNDLQIVVLLSSFSIHLRLFLSLYSAVNFSLTLFVSFFDSFLSIASSPTFVSLQPLPLTLLSSLSLSSPLLTPSSLPPYSFLFFRLHLNVYSYFLFSRFIRYQLFRIKRYYENQITVNVI